MYDVSSSKQINHVFNQNSRIFSCVAFSPDGRFLATGEGTSRQPEIAIWELGGNTGAAIKKLKGHRYGIECLQFSPNGSHLVSVGTEHDKGMFVWDWQAEKRITSNKLAKRVYDITFTESGELFATAGVRTLKY